MAIAVSNLWEITDELIQLLNANKGGATFTVTDRSPDEIRSLPDDTYLSLYLFHVTPDKYQRNALPVAPTPGSERVPRALRAPYQPLSLELYYLLTAYAKGDNASRDEQQAMTAALKCFHERPIVTATVPGSDPNFEFVLTLEPETADSVGRLWQAVTSSLRLSVVYKVSVVLIEPPAPPVQAKKPEIINLAVSPTDLPFARTGQVASTYIRTTYIAPDNQSHSYELVPATVAPGQPFILFGAGLNQSSSDRLYLVLPDGTESDITSWISQPSESRFLLNLPIAGLPPAGVYQLRVGNAVASGAEGAIRSNTTPLSLAAWIDPAGRPILSPVGSTYTLNGQGFSPGTVEVFLETIALSAGGSAAPGQFNVSSSSAIAFQLPEGLPNGTYALRVRVNRVESAPAKWVVKS
jgi:Pvc16 N-terminal domain